jgi:hypothetical protein
MTITLDGTAGISTPPLSVQGSTSGSITFAAPAVAGTNTQTLVAATGTLAPLIAGTAVASTSGTSIDFTGIPSWVKRITVMFSGVSTNGSSIVQVQLGTSGGIQATSYLGSVDSTSTGVNAAIFTTGLALERSATGTAANLRNGLVTFANLTSNTWSGTCLIGYSNLATVSLGATSIALGGTLDRVRITTVNGTDTFDAGSINILYE